MLNSRERRQHRCGDRLEIFQGEQRTLAQWSGGDLAAEMAKYIGILQQRGMERFMPDSARVVTRGGRLLESWRRQVYKVMA